MGIGVSVFLIAIGAILAFAVELTVSGLDINAVGFILMAAGAIGLVFALVAGRGLWGPRSMVEDEVVYGDEPLPTGRTRRRRYVS